MDSPKVCQKNIFFPSVLSVETTDDSDCMSTLRSREVNVHLQLTLSAPLVTGFSPPLLPYHSLIWLIPVHRSNHDVHATLRYTKLNCFSHTRLWLGFGGR